MKLSELKTKLDAIAELHSGDPEIVIDTASHTDLMPVKGFLVLDSDDEMVSLGMKAIKIHLKHF